MGEFKYWSKLNLGKKVAKGSTAIAGISTKPMFTITGGRVLVTALHGEVATTDIQAQANNLTINVDPTVGAIGALGTLIETSGALIGTTFSITGNPADAIIKNTGGAIVCKSPVIIPAGVITYATVADNTGEMKWTIWYIPLDRAAYVTVT